MPELSLEQINELLQPKVTKETPTKRVSELLNTAARSAGLPKTVQVGPLRWADQTLPCVSRNCSSPTLLRLKGAAYCSSHMLTQLNKMLVELTEPDVDLNSCNCNSGKYSNGNIHMAECELFKQKEEPGQL